jgi:hypothetical protein
VISLIRVWAAGSPRIRAIFFSNEPSGLMLSDILYLLNRLYRAKHERSVRIDRLLEVIARLEPEDLAVFFFGKE